MEPICECLIAFCEVTLQAVIEYQESEDNSKECLLEMLELALHYLVLLEEYLSTETTDLIRIIQQLLMSISCDQESRNNKAVQRGRPKLIIDKERLVFLKECGFKSKDIAAFLGCCTRKIERRINEYSILHRCDVYSAVTDAELDERVSSIIVFFPRCGQKSVDG